MSYFNGDRLKIARQYRGLTVDELSKKVNVSKQAISQYENNKIVDMPPERIALLSQALNFPYKYFFQESNEYLKSGTTYFRSLMKTSKKLRTAQKIKCEHITKLYSILNEYVVFPDLNLPENRGQFEGPSEAASALRTHWNLGNRPINNIIQVAEKNGIIITFLPTETDDIDAFSHCETINEQTYFIIAISSNKKSAARINFDIAHELGHIMLHGWSEDEETLSREEFKLQEKEANEFASAFLLPSPAFNDDINLNPEKIYHYKELKRKWKTSIAAMLYRACSLDIITPNKYQYMMRIMQNKGWRKEEPFDNTLSIGKPSLFNDSIELLLVNEIFTPEELMYEFEQFGLPMYPDEIENLLYLKSGILKPKPTTNKIVSLKSYK